MGSLPVIAWQPLSDAGAILAGAKAYFYRTGTSTAKNTYSDKALSSANANPVVADASGRFGSIFLLKDEGYRVVLKTSADVTIWTKDEVFADSFAVDEATRRKAIAVSPMDYGATGDGSADDTTAVQSAITGAAGGVVDLEGKTYKCTGTISISTSGTTVRNGKLLFTSAAATPITITGTLGSAVNFAANGALGANSVTLTSGSAFAALDLVLLSSSSTSWGDNALGQLEYLKGVSGAVLTLSGARGSGTGGALLSAYNTADTAKAQKLTPITDVRFEDVTIEAQATSATVLTLTYCERVSIRNCRFLMASTCTGVSVRTSAAVGIEGCHFAANSTSGFQVAVEIIGSSRDVSVSNTRVRFSSYGVSAGGTSGSVEGVCRYIRIDGADIELVDTAIQLDNGCKDVTIAGCVFNGGNASGSNTDLVNIEGYDVSVSGCQIIDPVRHWVRIHPQDNTADTSDGYGSYTITDCRFSGVGSSSGCLIAADPETNSGGIGYGIRLDVVGNTFSAGSQLADAIYIGSSSSDGTFQAVNIAGNTFTGLVVAGADYCVHVKCSDANVVAITGNTIYEQSAAGFALVEAGADDVLISNNSFGLTAGLAYGIRVIDATRVQIMANMIAAATGIDISASTANLTDLVISGNRIACSDDGIAITSSTGRTITRAAIVDNVINNTTTTATEYCLELLTAGTGTISKVSIVGNVFDRADDAGPTCFLNGAGGEISQVSAVANVLTNGTYGFRLTQVTGFKHSDNVFNSMATGQITGTFTRQGARGYIPLDITTLKITSAGALQATTEGMLPDTNTDPSLSRINGATDKGHRVVWAAASVVEVDLAPFAYPPDLDDGEPVIVNLLIAKSGNTDTSAVVAVSYFEGIGDTNAGGNTAALSTAALTKYTVTIAASDVGAYPAMAKIGLTPGTHANDAIHLHAAWIEYTRNTAINAS